MIINMMRIIEKGFIIRTMTLQNLGNFLCIKKPIARGIKRPIANVAIFEYGTFKSPCSNIYLPKVKSQKGMNAEK